jgi:hypothetical protein
MALYNSNYYRALTFYYAFFTALLKFLSSNLPAYYAYLYLSMIFYFFLNYEFFPTYASYYKKFKSYFVALFLSIIFLALITFFYGAMYSDATIFCFKFKFYSYFCYFYCLSLSIIPLVTTNSFLSSSISISNPTF